MKRVPEGPRRYRRDREHKALSAKDGKGIVARFTRPKAMHMRPIALVVLMTAAQSLMGQQWCAPGAVWTYRFQEWGGGDAVDYRAEYRYTADTILDGIDARRIQCMSLGHAYGQPIADSWTMHEALSDDVVLTWHAGSGWDTLYWFGAQIGDRWWPPLHPMTCPPQGMLEVLDTGDTLIGGLTLGTWSLGQVNEDGIAVPGITLVERIGMTPREAFIDDCSLIIEYYQPSFICYSDNDIQWPNGSDCQLTLTSSNTNLEAARLLILPNPGTDHLQLSGLGSSSAQVNVRDALGRLCFSTGNYQSGERIRTENWAPGSYCITVISATQSRTLQWLKQ
ncbi:MAG: T9SS type A sorting domain-containing protein [Flavobacteriales bacterium]|nr:T9SS type A sorting domain-containing protein [Flavobacteriales bacterium]